jgi:hypothetical protein
VEQAAGRQAEEIGGLGKERAEIRGTTEGKRDMRVTDRERERERERRRPALRFD